MKKRHIEYTPHFTIGIVVGKGGVKRKTNGRHRTNQATPYERQPQTALKIALMDVDSLILICTEEEKGR